ncbi:MAG: ferredoxin--NADP(+) reductase, partial [Gammaproteobacteria bacterium]|nr:ferredoxin--NADP(+) reductase [Gammaproteobacteria bacterium]
GNSAMISDVTEVLEKRGLRKHRRREPGHITTEKYH